MPRSVRDIINSADELARQFEQMQPQRCASPALAAIHRAVVARAQAEAELVEAVAAARREGQSWAHIGAYLGTSGEAARQKYGHSAQRIAPGA
ncbi:MAG: hypothetical protein U0R27_13940 [Candidatus Nanopelagicales bacterium]